MLFFECGKCDRFQSLRRETETERPKGWPPNERTDVQSVGRSQADNNLILVCFSDVILL